MASRAGRSDPRVRRLQRDRVDDALGGGHGHLAVHRGDRLGVLAQTTHRSGDVHRVQGHRQHPAGGLEQPTDPVEGVHRVAEKLPEADDQQVPDDVATHLTVAGEPVLEHPGPGLPPVVVPAQRREGHPQVAGGQDAELAAQPPRGAPVVGDRDDRRQLVDGEVVHQPTQRLQRRVQPVAATEGDHRLGSPGARRGHLAHSRPRSRCCARASYPSAASLAVTSSVIATLRCLPPVQPIAIRMNRLFSRR